MSTQEKSKSEIYLDLVDHLKHDFGSPMSDLGFTERFGSVLAELPEGVFEKISQIKNLFFVFTPFPGANIKRFQVEDDLGPRFLTVVNFPFETAFMTFLESRGIIAHELAHIYLGHISYEDAQEHEADKLARKWGFRKEIDALREYEKTVIQPQFEEGTEPS